MGTRHPSADRAVIDRAFSLLTEVHESGARGAGVSALSRATGLPKSTAFRLLTMLERNGAVEKVGTQYHVGPTLRRMAHDDEVHALDDVRDALTPYLVDLATGTGGSVHLATLVNDHVLYLTRVHGHNAPVTRVRVGHRAPAHSNAAGKALLSSDPEAAERVLAQPLERRTEHTVVDPARLAAELGHAAAAGVAVEYGEALTGLNCVGVALSTGRGPQFAISVATYDTILEPHCETLRRVRVEAERAARLVRLHRANELVATAVDALVTPAQACR